MDRQQEKIKVTNNEYNQIMQDEVDNYWKKIKNSNLEGDELKKFKSEAWDECNKKLDSYEVLPFDVNTDNKELIRLVNLYCSTEDIFEDKTIYRGFCPRKSVIYTLADTLNASYIYNDYYQSCICNDDLRMFFSYTEGDVSFTVCNSEKLYLAEKERINKFYSDL